METIYQKPDKDFTAQEYLEGRTLISVKALENDEHFNVVTPHRAEFELDFRLCSDKYIPIYIGTDDFHDLLTDDISRIKLRSAFEAEKKTCERIKGNCGKFEQERIANYLEVLQNMIDKSAQAAQKAFGGEGK